MPIQNLVNLDDGLIFHTSEDPTFSSGGFLFIIGIFYPSGKPISPHRHRCSPFGVGNYSLMGSFLAAAAISTRE
jgi:hypothetical protein